MGEINNITTKDIMHMVCLYFDVAPEDLFSRNRKEELVKPRQMYYYLCKKHTKHSYKFIGDDSLSGIVKKTYNHATVLFGDNQIKKAIYIKDSTILPHIIELEYRIKSIIRKGIDYENNIHDANLTILKLNEELIKAKTELINITRNGLNKEHKEILTLFDSLNDERKKDAIFKIGVSLKIQNLRAS